MTRIEREREAVVSELLAYFEEHEEDFNKTIEELDSYNGYLDDDRYYYMEELDEFYHGVEPSELLNRVFYGYDADTTWTDERGEKHYGEFNPNREYFTYNGYGNLVSSDYKDYSAHLDNWFITNVIERADDLDLSDEVIEIIYGEDEEA